MTQMTNEPPMWLAELVREWRDRLQLWETAVAMQLGDLDAGTLAEASLTPNINHARITFRRDLADQDGPTSELEKTIIHELIHVALAGITDAWADDVIDQLAPAAQMLARDWLHRAIEPAVERMAQAIHQMAGKYPEEGKDG